MYTRFAGLVSVAALLLLFASLAAASPRAAGAPIRVVGSQTEVDPGQGKFAMHGSLVGPWQITSFKPTYMSATQFAATGTELFTGCLDSNHSGACDAGETTGTLRFAATFWGEVNPTTHQEIRGGCYHAVTGGTGGFAGAKGVLSMIDTPAPGGKTKTAYRGELQLSASAAAKTSSFRIPQGARVAAGGLGC